MNMKELDYPGECPECHSTNVQHNTARAEIVCRECGLVLEECCIDYSSNVLLKKGGEMILCNAPLSKSMWPTSKDRRYNKGKHIIPNARGRIVAEERAIETICSQLDCPPQLLQKTEELYIKYVKYGNLNGFTSVSKILSCYYVASHGKNLHELATHFGIKPRQLRRCIKVLWDKINENKKSQQKLFTALQELNQIATNLTETKKCIK